MPEQTEEDNRRDPDPGATSPDAEPGHQLVAVLAADAVNYSRRMDNDEDGAYRDLVECRRIMAEEIHLAGGGIVSTPGDFLLAAFGSGSDALRAALSMQSAIARRNQAAGPGRSFDFRIGIGLGDIIKAGDDIHGTAVNVAARLQQLAAPGGVLIAGSVYDAVSHQSGIGFRFVGTKKLRNLSQPVQVYAAFWPGDASVSRRSTDVERRPAGTWTALDLDAAGFQRPCIEVADFDPLTAGEDTRLIAAGIDEEIITALSRVQGSLIVRQAARASQAAAADGRDRYLLSGSVRLVQDELIVTARLIDAESSVTRWADRFAYGPDDKLDIPQVIAREVVAALQITLTDGQQAELWKLGTTSFRAWESFLRGHDQESRYRRECHVAARRFYAAALEADLGYIAAVVALAFCHLDEIRLGWSRDEDRSFAEANRLSQQAAIIDPDYPDLHALIAYMHLHRGDHEAALRAMRHAQELEPRSPELAGYLGALLDSIGRQHDAIEAYKQAMSLSSHCPAWIASNLALTFCAVGLLEDAERTYLTLLDEHPDYVRAHIGLSAVYVRQDRWHEAQGAARRVLMLDPNFRTEEWRRHQPFSDTATLDAFVADLTTAGLP